MKLNMQRIHLRPEALSLVAGSAAGHSSNHVKHSFASVRRPAPFKAVSKGPLRIRR